jgi:uncharacterized protein DUF6056
MLRYRPVMSEREQAQHRSPPFSRLQSDGTSGVRERVIVVASVAVMLVLLGALCADGFASWPTADDYCNGVLVGERGFGGALHWLFFEWSGRVVSGIALYAAFALVDLPALHWVSVSLAGLLAVAACQIGSLVADDDSPLRWPLCAFAFGALVLGLYRLLGQAVLWSTGGIVYMVPLILALLWFGSVRRLLRGYVPRGGAPYGFIIGVLAGNSIELVWPILIAYVALVTPPRWHALFSAARRGLVARIAGLVAGMLVLAIAPGNYARAKVTPGSFTFEPSILASHYFSMLKAIASVAWPMIVIVVAIAIVSLSVSRAVRAADPSPLEPSPYREAGALAIGALLSVVPVLAVPPQFAPRNGFYLLIFVLVAAMIPLAALARDARWRALAAPALIVLAALGSVLAAAPLVADARQSEIFRERQIARDRLLRALPRGNVADAIVAPIGVWPVPATLHFVDVDPDREQWNNVCVAKYYGLRSVALGPTPR